MSEVTMRDAVISAMEGNPSEFKSSVNTLMMDKIRDAVDIEKMNIAASFMSTETEEEVTNDEEV